MDRAASTSKEEPCRPPARHEDFALAPQAWYYFGPQRELSRGPVRLQLPNGQAFVGFQTASGAVSVLSARCCHMNTDLARGSVVGERLACPLHGWEFGRDGRCERIPVQSEIPAFARQACFPTEVRRGHVFFFNQAEARYPLPFFEEVAPEDLHPARPFTLEANVPWYFVGANGFDVQHFLCAHDRVMLGAPQIDAPSPHALRITVRFQVAGHSLADRLTRTFAGPEVTMTITSWAGTLLTVTARFRRTTSYGLMTVHPQPGHQTRARVVVWVRRSRGALGRRLLDPVNASIRRSFVHRFLTSDIERMAEVRHHPHRLLPIDDCFARYLDWLRDLPP
ncbi:MAG: Rieske 2Fe-2S domain-containing protein [Opitutaceae bacterium]|nr:Rieske 2Fe-2S domain-containing protein [Opitutaceae bacterium]